MQHRAADEGNSFEPTFASAEEAKMHAACQPQSQAVPHAKLTYSRRSIPDFVLTRGVKDAEDALIEIERRSLRTSREKRYKPKQRTSRRFVPHSDCKSLTFELFFILWGRPLLSLA